MYSNVDMYVTKTKPKRLQSCKRRSGCWYMQWPTGLMILRGQGLSMTNRQEDICNSRVAFATEITEITSQEIQDIKFIFYTHFTSITVCQQGGAKSKLKMLIFCTCPSCIYHSRSEKHFGAQTNLLLGWIRLQKLWFLAYFCSISGLHASDACYTFEMW